jgi:predicted Zn finger-like uncharacterized protein
MKIVCEACQAKYSIADDKVRGKVFKIRCKKCSHVIVVRGAGEGASGASGEFATSPSSAPDLALDAGWHIVVDGEQVGPLSEGDIKSRLVRGEITPETYIWKEGLADWVKIATLAEFASANEGLSAGESNGAGYGAEPGGLFANAATNAGGAPAGYAAPAAGDLFAAPTRPVSDEAPTRVSSGGYAAAASGYDAPMPAMSMGGGMAASGGGGGGLTGQRHENSVLFSLSNLEALAKPSSAPLPAPRAASPSTSSTTEGSGLIDIRAMANMTLGGSAARPESRNTSDLPAFSAPQFSPVAPVLLAPTSSTPRWLIGTLIGLIAVALILIVIISAKMFSTPEPVAVAPVPAAPVPAAPAAAKPAAVPAATAPPATPPPAANEQLPPRETKPEPEKVATGAKPPRGPGRKPERAAGGRETARHEDAVSKSLSGFGAAPKPAADPPPRKPKDDIEALLEAASGGSRRSSAPARREVEDAPAPSGEKLPPLGREEIVKGMNGVLPKARDCYAQFKVPGVANAKITVNSGGRVTGVNVSGKFAGTPSGNCVESAIKTARFAQSAGLTFDYPVPLR